ncbi:MAG: NAD(P)H-hydrate dehydratase [Acidobacteriota bacterium]|nr:NAD(P)H-hydrate dehydratase [Acidobacteriota bacterium]
MRVLGSEDARALDARTIEAGTPGLVLMRRAANAVVREIAGVIARRPARGARVVVLAGPGNNGGDGFETARLLQAARVASNVETLLFGAPEHLSADARRTHQRLEQAGGVIREVTKEGDLEPLRVATVVVDALFGTGLKRPISPDGLPARAVRLVAEGKAFVVSVDLPSGLSADDAVPWTPAVRADLTVTFGYPKPCHVTLPAASLCGRIAVAGIGFLPLLEDEGRVTGEAVAAGDVALLFPRREAGAHKGSFGRLLVVGGSLGMAGAPALAARGAHRSGAGTVTVFAPESVRAAVHMSSPETMTVGEGVDFARFDALAVGPGLGASAEARALVERAADSRLPAVFDADALNLAGDAAYFARRPAPTVLTPHPGEAGRLLGIDAARVNADRETAARTIAARAKAVVILKGFRSLVADPSGRVVPVLAGNPAMASGGTGDVLTGVVGACLARGFDAWDAACAAAWLHGTAGDFVREEKGEESLTASDVVEALPEAFFAARESGGG